MPAKITKVGPGRYRVSTPHGVKSKSTTLPKAKAQKRILEEYDEKPKKRRR